MDLLLVEDDEKIAAPLIAGLERQGFAVTHVRMGVEALSADLGDVVLLDLGLPDIDGLDVCRQLRARSDIPILVITARGEELDKVVGLEVGADDYIVKPFGLRELVARIRAVMRRMPSGPAGVAAAAADEDTSAVSALGRLVVDRRTRRVTVEDVEVALTPKEFDLLALLATDAGAVFRREDIIEAVWDRNWFGPTRTIDVHVAALRKKLGDPTMITTVRGVGFRLEEGAR